MSISLFLRIAILFYCMESTARHAKCSELALMPPAPLTEKSTVGNQNGAQAAPAAAGGLDPLNAPDKNGRTPLLQACERADKLEKLCLGLLDRKVETNVCDLVCPNLTHNHYTILLFSTKLNK